MSEDPSPGTPYATLRVEFKTELDPELLERVRAYWADPNPLAFNALPERPARPYSRDEVMEAAASLAKHHFSQAFPPYQELKRALFTPDTQLGRRAAHELWSLLTDDTRFDRAHRYVMDPAAHVQGWLSTHEELQADEAVLRTTLRFYYQAYCARHGGQTFDTQAPLAGLASLIIGPVAAWRIWRDVVPLAHRGNICDFLVRGDAAQEQELAEGIRAETLNEAGWIDYRVSTLVRVPHEEELAALLAQDFDATMSATE